MTDQERDPEADGPETAVDPEPEADTAPADDVAPADTDDDSETFDDESEEPQPAPAGTPAAAAATTARRPKGPGAKGAAKQAAATPTVADEAVKIQDRASAWFVIGTIGVFVAILLYALVLGAGGISSDALKTPKPEATPIVSVAPSAAPSADPSAAPSVDASAPSSAEPSVAPSAEPSAEPSVQPTSPSPAAS